MEDRYHMPICEDPYTVEPVGLLQILDLKHVTVVIADSFEDAPSHLKHYQTAQLKEQVDKVRWPLYKKREVAESSRRILLKPDGAEAVKQTMAARKEFAKNQKEALKTVEDCRRT